MSINPSSSNILPPSSLKQEPEDEGAPVINSANVQGVDQVSRNSESSTRTYMADPLPPTSSPRADFRFVLTFRFRPPFHADFRSIRNAGKTKRQKPAIFSAVDMIRLHKLPVKDEETDESLSTKTARNGIDPHRAVFHSVLVRSEARPILTLMPYRPLFCGKRRTSRHGAWLHTDRQVQFSH